MKKSIVAAGVSAVALAAMPAVGVFADTTSQVDTLSVQLQTTCTIDSATHAPGTASQATSWSGNTLTATAVAGAAYNNIGTTTFKVICNNAKGWNITTDGASVSLVGQTTTDESIPNGTVTANTDAWSFTPSQDGAGLTLGAANASPVATYGLTEAAAESKDSAATGNAGKTFVVTYGVSTSNAISAQTYEGSITYTLNQINS